MKTKITITLLLITIAMKGQTSDGFISSTAYRIEQVTYIGNELKDTSDYTDDFIKDNGFIILANYSNHDVIISFDKGENKLIFLGTTKIENELVERDSMLYVTEGMARSGDGLLHATVLKEYQKGSLEDTTQKIFTFRLTFHDAIWNFITTEVITDNKIAKK